MVRLTHDVTPNTFIPGKSKPGYSVTHFFPKQCLGREFESSEENHSINGYASYSYIFLGASLVGVTLFSIRSKTSRSRFLLRIGIEEENLPDYYEPQFFLEKMGLLIFLTSDSSMLVTPTEISSSLLVRIT